MKILFTLTAFLLCFGLAAASEESVDKELYKQLIISKAKYNSLVFNGEVKKIYLLKKGANVKISTTLYKDVQYLIICAGDFDAKNIDLKITDFGKNDKYKDAVSSGIIQTMFKPAETGNFIIEMSLPDDKANKSKAWAGILIIQTSDIGSLLGN